MRATNPANRTRLQYIIASMTIILYHNNSGVGVNQTGVMVANPARGQLSTGKHIFPLSSFAPANLVSQDKFGRPVPPRFDWLLA